MSKEIRPEFDVHALNPLGIQRARDIASCFSTLLNDLEEHCGKDGREMALVRTHLQEAAFHAQNVYARLAFAKRSMAMRVENQIAPAVGGSMSKEIRPEFDVHMLNGVGIQKARDIASCFSILLNDLEEHCGKDGREMALVRTHLQEAAFFAKRSMAMRAENQIASADTEPPPAV